jgi:hypothetical protein
MCGVKGSAGCRPVVDSPWSRSLFRCAVLWSTHTDHSSWSRLILLVSLYKDEIPLLEALRRTDSPCK